MSDLKPCPMCGEQPYSPDADGGYDGGVDYEGPRCCWIAVDFQISDVIPDEMRFSEGAWNNDTNRYRDDIIKWCEEHAAREWNIRPDEC